VNAAIGAVVTSGFATLRDLDEWYSTRDMYDLLEIVAVNGHNRALLEENSRKDG